jgi:hypothetical protein
MKRPMSMLIAAIAAGAVVLGCLSPARGVNLLKDHLCLRALRCDNQNECENPDDDCSYCSSVARHYRCWPMTGVNCAEYWVQPDGCGYWWYGSCNQSLLCLGYLSDDPCAREACYNY